MLWFRLSVLMVSFDALFNCSKIKLPIMSVLQLPCGVKTVLAEVYQTYREESIKTASKWVEGAFHKLSPVSELCMTVCELARFYRIQNSNASLFSPGS